MVKLTALPKIYQLEAEQGYNQFSQDIHVILTSLGHGVAYSLQRCKMREEACNNFF